MKRVSCGPLVLMGFIMFLVASAVLYPGVSAAPQELPSIDVGLPEDRGFGLAGQYVIDKKIDRKQGFIVSPRWAGVAEIERLLAIAAIPLGLTGSEAASCTRKSEGNSPPFDPPPYDASPACAGAKGISLSSAAGRGIIPSRRKCQALPGIQSQVDIIRASTTSGRNLDPSIQQV